MLKLALVPFLLSTIVLVLAACGPSPTPTPVLGLDEIVARSRTASEAVTSYRFLGEIEAVSEEGAQRGTVSGEAVSPDRYRMRMEGQEDGQFHVNEFLTIGGRIFSIDLHGDEGEWIEQAQRAGGVPGRPALPFQIENAELMQDDVIDGVPVFHLHGESTRDFGPTPEPDHASVTSMRLINDLYISKADYRAVRKVMRTEMSLVRNTLIDGLPTITMTDQSTITTHNYYDYNEPIAIVAPEGFGALPTTTRTP